MTDIVHIVAPHATLRGAIPGSKIINADCGHSAAVSPSLQHALVLEGAEGVTSQVVCLNCFRTGVDNGTYPDPDGLAVRPEMLQEVTSAMNITPEMAERLIRSTMKSFSEELEDRRARR